MKHHVTITVTLLTITALALIALLFVPTIGASTSNDAYLPMIINMFTPTPTNTPTPTATPSPTPSPTPTITPTPVVGNVLTNGSFEQGWTDMPPAPGNLINQQPNGWQLSWVPMGSPLWDVGATSLGVPEALHKLDTQLPAHEQVGQPDALILEGSAVYKIFHFGSSFGATLKQTVTGLTPGTTFKLTVPVLMVQHNTSEVFAGASGVFVNGNGTWVWDLTVGDRSWYTHNIDIVVPADGIIDVELRVLSKWTKKDFFIDDIRLIQQ